MFRSNKKKLLFSGLNRSETHKKQVSHCVYYMYNIIQNVYIHVQVCVSVVECTFSHCAVCCYVVFNTNLKNLIQRNIGVENVFLSKRKDKVFVLFMKVD